MTYTTVGVKLVGMARYGARFVVLKHPFLSDWLSKLNIEMRNKKKTSDTKYYTVHSVLPDNDYATFIRTERRNRPRSSRIRLWGSSIRPTRSRHAKDTGLSTIASGNPKSSRAMLADWEPCKVFILPTTTFYWKTFPSSSKNSDFCCRFLRPG